MLDKPEVVRRPFGVGSSESIAELEIEVADQLRDELGHLENRNVFANARS